MAQPPHDRKEKPAGHGPARIASFRPYDLVPGGPGARRSASSFYTWNLHRRFGDEFRPKWAEFTTRRLAAWGFNTLDNWGAPSRNLAEPKVPYALMMRG